MQKYLTLLLFIILIQWSTGQNIDIKNDIAYVNNKAYIKIEKKSNQKFFIYDLKTNEKLLKVKVSSTFNERYKRYDYHTRLYFYPLKKDLVFRDVPIKKQKDLIQFLYNEGVFLRKEATTSNLLAEYKRLSARAKCNKILKNDFSQIINDHFISVVQKDTIVINEVKYKCVFSAFYIQKAMFDRYGKWDKVVFPYKGAQHPNLIWNNINLLHDSDKKFTVIARGYEGQQTIYASMMILDEKGNDMLATDAPHRFYFIELFGGFIKNNLGESKFYETYWTTFNPERWKRIQEYKRRKNTTRATSPFFQKPSQPRTVIRNQ